METDKRVLIQDRIRNLGNKLGFLSYAEVGTGQERSSWLDVVWFDNRISGELFEGIKPIEQKVRKREGGKPSLDTDFMLPLIGFEIEDVSTSYKVKQIKGSATNLDSLGALVGVILIYINSNDKELLDSRKKKVLSYLTDMKPRTRILVLTDNDLYLIENNLTKRNLTSGSS
jgi:hypothetical protein